MNLLKGQLTIAFDGGIDQILSDRGRKESGGSGKREGSPSDHPMIKGTFTVSGSGGGATTPATTRRRRTPTTGGQSSGTSSACDAFSQWPNIKGGVTCNSCRALVLTAPYGGRCDRYCQSFGHSCAAAAEEENDNCQVKYSTSCNQPITDTSDMLCTCQKGGATTPVNPQQGAGSTPQTSSNCQDGNGQCASWAATGECARNPGYMSANCKKSCNTCPQSGGSNPAGQGSTPQSNGCRDDNNQCAAWATNGECTGNPGYMTVSCKKSCNSCR